MLQRPRQDGQGGSFVAGIARGHDDGCRRIHVGDGRSVVDRDRCDRPPDDNEVSRPGWALPRDNDVNPVVWSFDLEAVPTAGIRTVY